LDWSAFESGYHGSRGQPPIHPRVLAGVTLYGLMTRIRSSRSLEQSLQVRLDFRWLAEGRSIDHTTLSEFRRKQGESLKNLFVQVGLVARQLGLLPLEQLAYDGTRLRANNRRSGTRSTAELQKLRDELAKQYTEQEQSLAAEDARENERMGDASAVALPADLADKQRRLAELDAALAELERVKTAGETIPSRIPLTDPQSRVTPNKEGGFAPNYTPLATVDCQSGLIVASDVIAMTNEEHFLKSQIEQVQQDYGLSAPPPEMLADGMMASGANLQALDEMGVTLYSPIKTLTPAQNPALRADPKQPVCADQLDRLPTIQSTTHSGVKQTQFAKEAFIYDAEQDCYWCPNGQPLVPEQRSSAKLATGTAYRMRYKASTASCAACPLRTRCVQQGAERRQISRSEHEPLVEKLAQRMSTPEAQAKYTRRREVAERPFAVIKQQFGARQFLLRGLEKVRIEWRWLTTAFNLTRLMSLWPSRAGPDNKMSSLQGCQG
jgi:transposase